MMDVSGISGAPATTNSSQAKESVSTAVFKKGLEVEEQQVTDLIASLPDPTSSLGQNINIKV